MSLYFAATQDNLTLRGDHGTLPASLQNLSVCFWGYRRSGVSGYGTFLSFQVANGVDWIETNEMSGADTLMVSSENANTGAILTLPTNGWFWAGWVSSGGGGGQNLKAYAALSGDASISTATCLGTDATAMTTSSDWMTIGNYGYSGGASQAPDADIGYLKIWNAALTDAEMEAERWSALPRRMANLYGFYPLWGDVATEAKCHFGLGATLLDDYDTYGATLSTLSPPVGWGVTESGLLVPSGKPLWSQLDEAVRDSNDYVYL